MTFYFVRRVIEVDGLEKINDTMVQVQIKLAELSTKLDAIGALDAKVSAMNDATIRNTDSTKAAHKRLDKIDKTFYWFWTSIFSGIIIAVVTFIVKGGLVK